MENSHVSGSIPVEKRDDGEYELAFEDVSFHYPGSEKLVLKNVSFKLRIKGKLAVVGRNCRNGRRRDDADPLEDDQRTSAGAFCGAEYGVL